MCKIIEYIYACGHHIIHIRSSCRGQIKSGSSSQACQKLPSLHLHLQVQCGSCERSVQEALIRQELAIPTNNSEPTPTQLHNLTTRIAQLTKLLPLNNWKRPLPPTHSRKPRDKRAGPPRTTSLLRCEVRAEDACGPDAFEKGDFVPDTERVYETVCCGWDYEVTKETRSLEEEIEEDVKMGRWERGGSEEDGGEGDWRGGDEAVEGDKEADDGLEESDVSLLPPPPLSPLSGENVGVGGGDECVEGNEEANDGLESDVSLSPPPPLSPLGEGSVRYWYRRRDSDTRGKLKSRCWELVQVT